MNKYYSKVITPDIIFLKFMGNDIKTSPESFRASNESMVENFKKLYPEALIVMASGKLNNEKCYISEITMKIHLNCNRFSVILKTNMITVWSPRLLPFGNL